MGVIILYLQAPPTSFEVRPADDSSSSDEEEGKPLSLVDKHKAKLSSKSRLDGVKEERKEEEEKAERLKKVTAHTLTSSRKI